jgi:hypothetical protein
MARISEGEEVIIFPTYKLRNFKAKSSQKYFKVKVIPVRHGGASVLIF